jgi:glycosyltransferase involved in cell wall biosynthesis
MGTLTRHLLNSVGMTSATRVAVIRHFGNTAMARLARMNIAAMLSAGLSVIDQPFRSMGSEVTWDFAYHHVNPGDIPSNLPAGKRVAYWTWGFDNYLPESWLDASEGYSQIWVPSSFTQRGLIAGGVDPMKVKIIPPFAHFGVTLPMDSRQQKLLTIFDGKAGLDCKNPWEVVEAFRQAFPQGTETISLTVKGQNLREGDIRNFQKAIGKDRRITLLEGHFNESAMNRLIQDHTGYVSLHRTGSFGTSLLQCMALGIPVVTTIYGGNADYCTAFNCLPVTALVSKSSNGGTWVEPDIECAAKQISALYHHARLPEIREIAQRAYADTMRRYSYIHTVKAIQQATSLL